METLPNPSKNEVYQNNMEKILVTGGSGFIGTNLIDYLLSETTYIVKNIDIKQPLLKKHEPYWQQIDLREKNKLIAAIVSFQPNYVIHLGARTDLNGISLQDYDTNIVGVKHLLEALQKCNNLKRSIFASSMYVCKPGYQPKHFEDYAPHTLYGESKVETERIIKSAKLAYTWSIIRPTSIWGPWFGEPYNNFFKIVLKGMYFHMGKRACKKTYGYIDNTIYQIMSILRADKKDIHKKVYYLGDYNPYDITEWANEIAKQSGIKIYTIPFLCFKVMAWIGDTLKTIGIKFPMTSFRLHNMTTNNIHNLDPIKEIAPKLPISRREGTKKTLLWIHSIVKH